MHRGLHRCMNRSRSPSRGIPTSLGNYMCSLPIVRQSACKPKPHTPLCFTACHAEKGQTPKPNSLLGEGGCGSRAEMSWTQGSGQTASGHTPLTWALRGSQERRRIRTRLYRTPASSVYLRTKDHRQSQTEKYRGRTFPPLQVYLRYHHSICSFKILLESG